MLTKRVGRWPGCSGWTWGPSSPVRSGRRYGLSSIEASEHDLLHGVALAAAELPEPEEGAVPPGAYTCC